MISAQEALERLKKGNREFAAGELDQKRLASPARRAELTQGQWPFAAIIGCSDSRVPPEIVFNQGLGDLFVTRVIGEVMTPPEIGSVEFAALQLGTRLVVVLGHARCGAIQATLQEIEQPTPNQSPHLLSVIKHIRPAVENLPAQNRDELIEQAVRADVRTEADRLKRESEALTRLIENDDLLIVGAEYSLDTGLVEFFED
jgi:carbonic anhydrase